MILHILTYCFPILDAIYEEYYSDQFDPSLYELTRLGDPCDQAGIDRDRKLLLQQLTVVSKKVFKLILDRQTDCTAQLDHIISVQVIHLFDWIDEFI